MRDNCEFTTRIQYTISVWYSQALIFSKMSNVNFVFVFMHKIITLDRRMLAHASRGGCQISKCAISAINVSYEVFNFKIAVMVRNVLMNTRCFLSAYTNFGCNRILPLRNNRCCYTSSIFISLIINKTPK